MFFCNFGGRGLIFEARELIFEISEIFVILDMHPLPIGIPILTPKSTTNRLFECCVFNVVCSVIFSCLFEIYNASRLHLAPISTPFWEPFRVIFNVFSRLICA